jgi:predicted Zn-dependent protease with MMP-like domain
VRREDFDQVAERAFRRIPARFRREMLNVVVVVEDEPSPAQLTSARVPRGHTLLGLYQGRPLPFRSVSEGFQLPDRITLFQGPIERAARDAAELERVVYDTLWHEVAHYFGMDEQRVRTAERRRSQDRLRRLRREQGS